MSLYTHQGENVRKTWLLMALFFGVVIGLGWVISYVYQNEIILYIAVIFAVVMNITSYWFSDKIAIKLAGAKETNRSEFPELWNVVENLSITAGLPMPKVFIINDQVPNAFATGRDKNHAVLAATTGLLNILNRTELEGVIAHELSHIGNRDMLVSTVAVVLSGFVSMLSNIFLRSMWFGNRDRRDDGGLIMILGIVFAILSPIFAMLIQLSISRKREYLADLSGALLTRYPEGLASALEKIGNYAGPMKHANTAIAHLYISNPFGKNQSWISHLFDTHPPIADRIRILREQ